MLKGEHKLMRQPTVLKGTATEHLPGRGAGAWICASYLARQRLRLHQSMRNKSLLQNEALCIAQRDVPLS